MAYSRQTWEDFVTLIDAEKMTHIEDGIVQNESDIANVSNSLAATLPYITGTSFDDIYDAAEANQFTAFQMTASSNVSPASSNNYSGFVWRNASGAYGFQLTFTFSRDALYYRRRQNSSEFGDWTSLAFS